MPDHIHMITFLSCHFYQLILHETLAKCRGKGRVSYQPMVIQMIAFFGKFRSSSTQKQYWRKDLYRRLLIQKQINLYFTFYIFQRPNFWFSLHLVFILIPWLQILERCLSYSVYNIMSCIFAKSKYYKESKADPLQVAPPLGYNFLYSNEPTKKLNTNMGQLVIKQTFDKPHHKVVSQKKTQFERLQQFLKVSEAPRKTIYLPPTLLQFMRKEYPKQIYQSISKCFLPTYKQQFAMVEMAQLIRNPNVQSLLHIQDYALSKFVFLCEGTDLWKMKYLFTFFNRRFIQYAVQSELINHCRVEKEKILVPSGNSTLFEPPKNIENVEQVKSLIALINQTNKKKDPLYNGVHFYFADFSLPQQNTEYFLREDSHLKYLQYYLTILTGVLGNGQTAIIKLCGTFKYKTSEYIFLLKLLFNGKVSLFKPLLSNPFEPYSYAICEYYNKYNGDIIHNYLLENYHLLHKFGEDQLILDPKRVLREDLHNNLRSFNEIIINKGIQNNLKVYQSNSNVQFYPNRDKILEKLPKYAIELDDLIIQVVKVAEKSGQDEMRDQKFDKNKSNTKVEPNTTNLNQPAVPRPTISSFGLFSKARK